MINTTKQPFIPDGWTVESHDTSLGKFEWNPQEVSLHLEPEQEKSCLVGTELQKRLKDKPVLNANVLDYLLKNPYLIPEEWKGKYVFFWGTIYRNSSGNLYVRCLYFDGDRWDWYDSWLDRRFDSLDPSAVRAVSSESLDSLTLGILDSRLSALEAKFEKLKNL